MFTQPARPAVRVELMNIRPIVPCTRMPGIGRHEIGELDRLACLDLFWRS